MAPPIKRITGNFILTPRHSYEPLAVELRTGDIPVKVHLPIFNPVVREQSVTAQAGACTNCKDPTCSSIGCPMGKDIGGANTAIAHAGEAISQAFEHLKVLSGEKAQEFIEYLEQARKNIVPNYAKLRHELFSRLRQVDQPAADKYDNLLLKHMREAFDIFEEGGGRGDIYGMACPSESMTCGAVCQLQISHKRGVTIAMNEASVYNFAWEVGWVQPIRPKIEKPQSIAIIGSGAAGTHIAIEARRHGCQVSVFDRNNRPGELGDGKIHAYKVPFSVWQRDWEWQEQSGINFNLGKLIGPEDLRNMSENFNVIVIATGTPAPRPHGLTGAATDAVVYSNMFLREQNDYLYQVDNLKTMLRKNHISEGDFAENLKEAKKIIPVQFNAAGKHVLINGHGDTAVDCARVAITQGASSVRLISRRDEINALSKGDYATFIDLLKESFHRVSDEPSREKQKAALSKVIENIERFRKDEDSYKNYGNFIEEAGSRFLEPQYYMEVVTIQYGDEHKLILEGSGKRLEADMYISATGNQANLQETFGISNLPLQEKKSENKAVGTLVVQLPAKSKKSDANGEIAGFVGRLNGTPVFAGGEVVAGSSLLVTCGKAGIDLERQIQKYFRNPEAFYKEAEAVSGRPVLDLALS